MPTQPYITKNGVRVPGVTTVLGVLGWKTPGLVHWSWKLGTEGKDYRKERDAAASAGTLAHAMAEAEINHSPQPPVADYPPEVAAKAEIAFGAFHAWRDQTRAELVYSEVALVSEVHLFGGCLDGVGLVDAKPFLFDIKTGAVYPEAVIQVSAYAQLWEEHHPDLALVGGAHILRFGKEGAFAHHFIPREALVKPWEAFCHCVALYHLRKPISKLI